MTYEFPEGTIVEHDGVVTRVRLPISRDEWVRMCVRDDGDINSLYIGPCCGSTGVAQDIACIWFRMNSTHGLSASEVCGEMAELHEVLRGHDSWNEEDMPNLADYAEEDPWARLLLLYETVRDRVGPSEAAPTPYTKNYDASDPDSALRVLDRLSHTLAWATFGDSDGANRSHMTRAWRLEQLQALIPAMHTVFHHAKSLEPGVHKGWAIVEVGTDKLAQTERGPAFYETQRAATEVAQAWNNSYAKKLVKAQERNDLTKYPYLQRKFEVRPCTISFEGGVVLQ